MGRFTIKLSYGGSVAKYLTYLILLVSLFLTFFSCYKASFGIECILLTIIILLLNCKKSHLSEILPFVIICGITLLLFLFSGQTGERGFNAPINHMLKFVYLMFTVALSIGMREIPREARAKVITWMLVSVLISVFISAYSAIFINRYAIRYPDEHGFTNVVDFAQFYGICVVLCALVFVILRYHKQYSVWKPLLVCIPILICIGVSLYVTGVLLTVIGLALGLVIHKHDQAKASTVLCAFVLILILSIVIIFGSQISDWFYKVTEPLNWILRDRLRSVADTIFRTNHNLMYSYDRRDELAGYSLATFANHPVLGIGYREYGYGVIGGHQEWQDLLGVFGIVGVIVIAFALFYLVSVIARNTDNKNDLHAFYISVVLFVMLGFLNPCLSLPTLTAVFVISPNISLVIPWWKESELNRKDAIKR